MVLISDLSTRRVGPVRLIRPFIATAAVVSFYLKGVVTSGHGLLLEVVGVVAAWPAIWIVVAVARLFFGYGANHLSTAQLAPPSPRSPTALPSARSRCCWPALVRCPPHPVRRFSRTRLRRVTAAGTHWPHQRSCLPGGALSCLPGRAR
jgi:hypothetical protein